MSQRWRLACACLAFVTLLEGCSSVLRPFAKPVVPRGAQVGRASWYGPGHEGKKTASGERFTAAAMTAAHPSLPFGTRVRVTNLQNGKSVVVRVNDRGPFGGGKIIDVSHAAANALGITPKGVATVRVEPLR